MNKFLCCLISLMLIVQLMALPKINVEDSCDEKFKEESERKIQAHYNKHPSYYSSVKTDSQTMKFFFQTNVTADRLASMKTFLDIGCGDGRLPIWLKRKYPNIEKADGFDYSSVRISIARKSVKMLGLEDSVQFSCSDVNYIFDLNIPYKYDLIAITEVLEHLQDPYSIIAKAQKYLTPNGRIVGTVPHRFAYNAHLQVYENLEDVKKKLRPDTVSLEGKEFFMTWLPR